MKKSLFKRIVTAVLAGAVVVSAVMTTAIAADDHSINIKGVPNSSAEFKAYQLFSGHYEEDGTLSGIEWGSGFELKDGESLTGTPIPASITAFLTELRNETAFEVQADSSAAVNLFSDAETAQDVADVLAEHIDDAAFLQKFAAITSECVKISSGTGAYSNSTYTISGLSDGYYIVIDSSTGLSDYINSKPILKVAGSDSDVEFKGDIPSIDKIITAVNSAEDKVSESGKTSSVGVGDTVSFKLTSRLPLDMADYTSGYYFKITDVLSKGLTLDAGTVKVQYVITGSNNTGNISTDIVWQNGAIATGTVDYTNKINVSSATDSNTKTTTLTITFDDTNKIFTEELLSGLEETIGKIVKIELIVTYDAVINENAVVGTDGNTNSANITYSSDPDDEDEKLTSTSKTTTSFTYQIDIDKNDGDKTPKALAGAEFVITRESADKTQIAVFDINGNLVKWVDIPEGIVLSEYDSSDELDAALTTKGALSEGESAGIVTGDDGKLSISGLAEGTYKLTEIKAPDGYKKVAAFEVTLAASKSNGEFDGKLDEDETEIVNDVNDDNIAIVAVNDEEGAVTIDVIDDPSTNLPGTGGSGVYFYYICGGALVLIAVITLIFTKKKPNNRS